MAFLEVVPKGKFGAQVTRSAVDLLKKYKLSALPDPSSLGKSLITAAPELGSKFAELDGLFKKMQVPPPQAILNWDNPNWNTIGNHFGLFAPNPTEEELTKAKNQVLESHTLKVASLVANAETVYANVDSAVAAQNLDKFLHNLPKEISGGARSRIEGVIKGAVSKVNSTSPSGGDKAAFLKEYESLKSSIEEEKTRYAKVANAEATQLAKSLNHPIRQYLATLNSSIESISNRKSPVAQAVWDQSQVVFEALNIEWNLRRAFAADQLKRYEQELELVDNMQEELEDTQADHLLILKPHLVDEILAKFYEMQIGEEEQELHLPSGFESLQEIEDAANVFLKEHKEFNDAEVLTSHLVEEETNAMLASGEHH